MTEEYDKAFADMAAEPLEEYEAQPFSNQQKQSRRRARLTQAANLAGFSTIDKLANAIIAGEVTVSATGR